MAEVDYSGLLKKAVTSLGAINKIAAEFSRYELAEAMQEDLSEVLTLSGKPAVREVIKTNDAKYAYAELINHLIQIEDNISEIEMLTSDVVREANKLPPEERKEFFSELGVEPIESEDTQISPERRQMLVEILGLAAELIDESEEFYSPELEDYLDAV